MKILIITNCFPPNVIGGAELTAQTIGGVFESEGHEVRYVTIKTDLTKPNTFSNVTEIKLANLFDDWRGGEQSIWKKIIWKILDSFNVIMGFRLYKVVKSFSPDIVFTHNIKGFSVSAWVAVKLNNVKLFHVFHDYYLICSNCALWKKNNPCQKRCSQCKLYTLPAYFLSFLVDKFIGVSHFITNVHNDRLKLNSDRLHVIHNARKPNKDGIFADDSFVKSTYTGDKTLIFGFIGRLEKLKGIELFFEASSRINGDFKLLIAGREGYPGYLDSIALKYPNVCFEYLGFCNSSEFYKRIDCLVMPSRWHEPFAGTVYEPMEYRIPVLAANVGGVPEVIIHGKNGFIFQNGNAEELADYMQSLINNRDILINLSQGTTLASSFFDLNRFQRAYCDLLQDDST